MQSRSMPWCSDQRSEPLPGSASRADVVVLFEHPNRWSRDILDGHALGEELSAALREKFSGSANLYFIRKPQATAVPVSEPTCYVAFLREQHVERVPLGGAHDLLHLDLSGPGRNPGSVEVTHPIVLVCTHGKRDVCCALKGRPLVQQLSGRAFELGIDESVWESSHTSGHRFAPAVTVLPWGYSYGHLNDLAAASLYDSARQGEFFVPGCRGRMVYDAHDQAAEVAVARLLSEHGEAVQFGQLTVNGGIVTHEDGRTWEVEVGDTLISGVTASCGKEPADKLAPVVTKVREL